MKTDKSSGLDKGHEKTGYDEPLDELLKELAAGKTDGKTKITQKNIASRKNEFRQLR